MRKTLTAAALVATVALAGCGGDTDPDDVSGTPDPTTEAPAATQDTDLLPEEPTDAVPQDQDVLHGEPEAFVHPGVEIGEHGGQIAEVGETVIISDGRMRMSWADVTLEGMARYEVELDGEMHHVSIMAFAIENNSDAGEPVQFLAPIDGGGMYYVAPDGTSEMLYNQRDATFAWDYAGYQVHTWHRGPYGPGDRQVVAETFFTYPDGDDFGSLQYRSADGYVIAEWEVMVESEGKDHQRLQEVQRAVDEMGFVFEW